MLNHIEEDTVHRVVQSFMDSEILFTALDVSNEVKKTLPQVRHRDVRDEVRAIFSDVIEVAGWTRTPISVTLQNGNSETALLYHPLSDAWDLDNKYDQQKRTQATYSSQAITNAITQPTAMPGNTAFILPIQTSQQVSQTATRDIWKQMFSSQPSLFPRK